MILMKYLKQISNSHLLFRCFISPVSYSSVIIKIYIKNKIKTLPNLANEDVI